MKSTSSHIATDICRISLMWEVTTSSLPRRDSCLGVEAYGEMDVTTGTRSSGSCRRRWCGPWSYGLRCFDRRVTDCVPVKSTSQYDRRPVSQYVLVSSLIWDFDQRSFFFSKLRSCLCGAPSLMRGRVCHLLVLVNTVCSSQSVVGLVEYIGRLNPVGWQDDWLAALFSRQDLVWATVRRLQSPALYVLMEEDMCAVVKILGYECSRTGVACCRNWSEASHMLAQLCDEVCCFHWLCGRSQELAGDSQWFSIHELSWWCLLNRFEWRTDAEKNEGKLLSPLLLCMAHDGDLQGPVEAFHESISCRMVSGCPGKVNAREFVQGIEGLWLKVTTLVGGDGLQATVAWYPASQKAACHGVGRAVRDRNDLRPACEAVNCSEALLIACGPWKGPDEIYVDVKETGYRQPEFSHWSNWVTGDFGALVDLASPCSGLVVLLYAWPHETLCDQLRCCLDAWVRQIVERLELLEPQGSCKARPRFPSRRVAVDGDCGAGNLLLLDS
jgi:hypothetical protein